MGPAGAAARQHKQLTSKNGGSTPVEERSTTGHDVALAK